MKIAKVIPIANGVFKDSLTYFTSKDIEVGSLVSIPVRNKKIPGILEEIKSVEDSKMDIKNSEYELKKIEKVSEQNIFLKEFIETAKETADYFAANAGQIINLLTPNTILKNYENHGNLLKQKTDEKMTFKNNTDPGETIVTQTYFEERLGFYKSLIREEFAKKRSVFICVPTIHDLNLISGEISKGIEKYSVVFDPDDSKKTLISKWQKALDHSHPALIIGTPLFLSIERRDLGAIIVEKESSPAYRSMTRPYIDLRFFIEVFAKKINAKLIFGDTVLRIETTHKKETGVYSSAHLFKNRYESKVSQKLIDLRTKKDPKKLGREDEKKNFEIISDDLANIIKASAGSGERTLLLCGKRGLASSTVCADCGEMIVCKHCEGPVTLHKEIRYNIFMCHKCGYKQSAEILCKKCGGWRLFTHGFGTEKVEEELKQKIPGIKTFIMDSDHIRTYKQGKDLLNSFYSTEGAALIATEMAIFYIDKPIENVGIVSVDPLFTIPDFKIKERIFGNLISARMFASKTFSIQTRMPEDQIFGDIMHGDILLFYRKDIERRKKRGYSPVKLLIKISHLGKIFEAEKEMGELEKFLSAWTPESYYSYSSQKEKNKINILLRLDPSKWPPSKNSEKITAGNDKEKMDLLEVLRSLPSRFVVRIDPDTIL